MEADALVKELTGATVMAMEQDVPALRAMQPGGKAHPIDRVLHDGEKVTLGGTTLTAHLTPGHTKGCTSWGLDVRDNGNTYHALIVCSFGVNDNYVLVDNTDYPQIASDYVATYAKARALARRRISWARMAPFTASLRSTKRCKRRKSGDRIRSSTTRVTSRTSPRKNSASRRCSKRSKRRDS